MQVPKIQKRFEAVQSAATKEATVYLYGYISDSSGWWSEEDIITPKDVREMLQSLNAETITLHINSYGGSSIASVTIYNLLRQYAEAHKAKINIHVDGMAASGGSIIAMAGDQITMPENTTMFIHRAWAVCMGNAAQLHKEADDLEKLDAAVCSTYKAHFIGTEEELGALLDAETTLTAVECKSLGFCTEMIPIKPPDVNGESGMESLTKSGILSKYGKKPDEKPKSETVKLSAAKMMQAFFDGINNKKE